MVLAVAVTEAGAFCSGSSSCLHCPAQVACAAAESKGQVVLRSCRKHGAKLFYPRIAQERGTAAC